MNNKAEYIDVGFTELSQKKYKTFLLKNIPTKDWKKFKLISIRRDITLNENLLRLVKDYVKLNYSKKSL